MQINTVVRPGDIALRSRSGSMKGRSPCAVKGTANKTLINANKYCQYISVYQCLLAVFPDQIPVNHSVASPKRSSSRPPHSIRLSNSLHMRRSGLRSVLFIGCRSTEPIASFRQQRLKHFVVPLLFDPHVEKNDPDAETCDSGCKVHLLILSYSDASARRVTMESMSK